MIMNLRAKFRVDHLEPVGDEFYLDFSKAA